MHLFSVLTSTGGERRGTEEAPFLSPMEDPKPITPQTQGPNPPNSTPPPPPNNASAQDLPNKKRKIDNADLQNSNFFKIRAIVKDLRPSILEVLHTPDFQNCKASHEILKQMMAVMELTKQLKMEIAPPGNPNKPSEGPELVAEKEEIPLESHQEKHAEQHPTEKFPNKTVEENVPGEVISENQTGVPQGSYIIGGSPIGWNFTMYPGSIAVYYGETKASFLSRQTKQFVAAGS